MKGQLVVAVLSLLFVGAVLATGGNGGPPSEPTKRVHIGDKTRVVGKGFVGCTERETFEKLTSLIVQQDLAAYNRALGALFADGICVRLRSEQEVYLTDLTISGLALVRLPGEVIEYWTNVEAVER